jgi:acyl-coenzyme A thioesterase PaaI-like protein
MQDEGFFARIVKGELSEAPITKPLGWKFIDLDAEQQVIKVEMQARPEFVNPAGFVQHIPVRN